MFIESVENGRVKTRVAGKHHSVVNGSEHIRAVDDAESGREFFGDQILVPEREIVMRHLCDALSRDSRRGCRSNECILISIAAGDAPFGKQAAVDADLKSVGALAAGLDDSGRVVRVGRARVGAVEPVDRRGYGHVAKHVPFDARFEIIEFFGLYLLRDRGQGRELVAGAGQIGNTVTAVERELINRLYHNPETRRHEPVDATKPVTAPVVKIIQIEIVEPHAADHLQITRDAYLVLNVRSREVCAQMVVRIGRALAKRYGYIDRRVIERHLDNGRSVVEVSGIPEIPGELAAKLESAQQRVLDAAGVDGISEICLAEKVLATRSIVVGRKVHERAFRIGGARNKVLIEPVIVAIARAIVYKQIAKSPVERGGKKIYVRPHAAIVRIPVISRNGDIGRSALKRRDAAVGSSPVTKEFVSKGNGRVVVGVKRDGWIDSQPFEIYKVAKAVRVFIDAVAADGEPFAECLADVHGRALIAEGTALEDDLAKAVEARGFCHTIYNSAASAATKDHCVRPAQHFEPLQIVKVAIILNIISNAVDIEIGARTLPADYHLIAVILALMGRNARQISDRIANAGYLLVGDLLAHEKRYRLGHIAELSVCFCRAAYGFSRISLSVRNRYRGRCFRDRQADVYLLFARPDRDRHRRFGEAIRRRRNNIISGRESKNGLTLLGKCRLRRETPGRGIYRDGSADNGRIILIYYFYMHIARRAADGLRFREAGCKDYEYRGENNETNSILKQIFEPSENINIASVMELKLKSNFNKIISREGLVKLQVMETLRDRRTLN